MQKVFLSDTEKRLLLSLAKNKTLNRDDLKDIEDYELYVAGKTLKEMGFIMAKPNAGILLAAMLLPKGKVYIKENPTLENPVDENELNRLQIDELEYKKKIRAQESIIRLWQTICAILGLIGFTGWMLFLFFK